MALALCCAVVTNVYSSETIWNIGELDGRADEFALAPDRFKEFLSRDFGYEDKYFVVGQSSIKKIFLIYYQVLLILGGDMAYFWMENS